MALYDDLCETKKVDKSELVVEILAAFKKAAGHRSYVHVDKLLPLLSKDAAELLLINGRGGKKSFVSKGGWVGATPDENSVSNIEKLMREFGGLKGGMRRNELSTNLDPDNDDPGARNSQLVKGKKSWKSNRAPSDPDADRDAAWSGPEVDEPMGLRPGETVPGMDSEREANDFNQMRAANRQMKRRNVDKIRQAERISHGGPKDESMSLYDALKAQITEAKTGYPMLYCTGTGTELTIKEGDRPLKLGWSVTTAEYDDVATEMKKHGIKFGDGGWQAGERAFNAAQAAIKSDRNAEVSLQWDTDIGGWAFHNEEQAQRRMGVSNVTEAIDAQKLNAGVAVFLSCAAKMLKYEGMDAAARGADWSEYAKEAGRAADEMKKIKGVFDVALDGKKAALVQALNDALLAYLA